MNFKKIKLEPAIIWKPVPCQRIPSKKDLTSIGRHLSLRYGQRILISRYPVLTAVNWSQYWCPICVSVFLSSDPKLARKYEIEHWSRSSKTINRSAVTSISDTWPRDMVMGHWSVAILFWQLSMDQILNVQCERCGLAKIRLRHPSLPFDSLPYPTRTIRRHVRTLGQSRDNQTTRCWPYSMNMGLCPRVGGPLQIVNEGKCRLDANRKLSPWKMTPSASLTVPRKWTSCWITKERTVFIPCSRSDKH